MSDELNKIPGNLNPDPNNNPVVQKLNEIIAKEEQNSDCISTPDEESNPDNWSTPDDTPTHGGNQPPSNYGWNGDDWTDGFDPWRDRVGDGSGRGGDGYGKGGGEDFQP